ncbi:MAG TPA: BTAD domain-containing putative transcriptional regulator, partial [Jiangellales bacterium]|nr:BTAD domain-containing putative transcriptional regulator [Jiangellales bacterium]
MTVARTSTAATGTTSSTDTGLAAGVLGPLEIWDHGARVDLPGGQERALLALLLTAPGRTFSVQAIVTALWGEDPPGRARKTAQSYVSRLRQSLPPGIAEVVVTRSPGYLVDLEPRQVDAERFRLLSTQGRHEQAAGRAEAGLALLREALSLWRGEPYADVDAPFTEPERTELEELRLATIEDRLAAELATGAGPELVSELEGLTARNPWRERLWVQLMTALFRAGRQADALAAYGRARAALRDGLGLEPSPDLRETHRRVLAQDERLLWSGTRAEEALPATLAAVGPTYVGRDRELARLLGDHDRAAAGDVVRTLLTGRHGIGKSRLLAELAGQLQSRGTLVVDGWTTPWPARPGRPRLAVLDDLQRHPATDLAAVADAVADAAPQTLVVGACVLDDAGPEQLRVLTGMFPDQLAVPPLDAHGVEAVVSVYVPAELVPAAVAAAADTEGVPLQVHAAASRYAEQRTAARVDRAAAGMTEPRRELAARREEIATGVLDLHRIRLAREAHAQVGDSTVVCPYKGLAYYDVDDAPYFFGRERLVATLVARLVGARALTVVGASGSGKSSLVRAGLVAAVRSGVLPGSERWHTVVTTPTKPRPEPPVDGTRCLLVVDQLEELFTTLTPGQRNDYAGWLAREAAREGTTVVLAVRSDYYPRAAHWRALAELVGHETVLVGAMSGDELRDAVELPASAGGLRIEPALLAAIVEDVSGRPGALPLLSTALLSLWEHRDGSRLTLLAYRELGGVQSAVARLAESAYARLTPDQQSVARRTLVRLAASGDAGEPVRRRVPLGELTTGDEPDVRTVLDTLAARRLLAISETHAEVTHEALLAEWPRLRQWLSQDEAGRRLKEHLSPAAVEWQARGRDPAELYRGPRLAAALDWQRAHPDDLTDLEHDFLATSRETAASEERGRRRSIRRLRALVAVLVAVVGVALLASLTALDRQREAESASLTADVRALQVDALNEERWDRALLLAAQAHRMQPSPASHAALVQTVQRSPEAVSMVRVEQPLYAVAASHDGALLAAGGRDGTVYVWDRSAGRLVHTLDRVTVGPVQALDFSPVARELLVVGPGAELFTDAGEYARTDLALVDLEDAEPTVRSLEVSAGDVPSATFSADGGTLVSVDTLGRLRYTDAGTGAVIRELDVEPPPPAEVVLSTSPGRRFMTSSNLSAPGRVVVWDVANGRVTTTVDTVRPAVAAVSTDGTAVALGSEDGGVGVIDVATGVRADLPSPLSGRIEALEWSPDGHRLIAATQERTVVVWEARTGNVERILRGQAGALTGLAVSRDDSLVHAASVDGTLLTWDLQGTGGMAAQVPIPVKDPAQAVLSADGSVGAFVEGSGPVQVVDLATGRVAAVERAEPDLVGLVMDRDGRRLAQLGETASDVEGKRGLVVEVSGTTPATPGEEPVSFSLDYAETFAVAFGADGDTLATAADHRVRVWDTRSGGERGPRVYVASDPVESIVVLPDGGTAALGLLSGTIRVVDLTSLTLVASLDAPGSSPAGVGLMAASPDGRWLATDLVGAVAVWDTATWDLTRVWETASEARVSALRFTPDSSAVVVGGDSRVTLHSIEQVPARAATVDVDPARPDEPV